MTNPHWIEEIEKCQVDSEVATFKAKVEAGETTKYAVHEVKLYYLSGKKNEEMRLRLYVPRVLRAEILGQCHDKLSHKGINKICDLVGRTLLAWSIYRGYQLCSELHGKSGPE